MTEEEMAAEKLATMDDLSAANARLECLKGRLERHSSLMGQVFAVFEKALSDRPSTSYALELPDLHQWPDAAEVERVVREFEDTERRISLLRDRMRTWGAV